MPKNHSNRWKNEQDMPFPNHGHDVVGTYDQFEFWSLRSSDVTLLSLHFKKVL
jgi:hypothetical protein